MLADGAHLPAGPSSGLVYDPRVSMHSTVVQGLESLSLWRADVDRALLRAGRSLRAHDLDGERGTERLEAVRGKLADERLVVAFVAEFSRGKSELINALLMSATGGRVLPASPGRTTMCPVELGWDPARPVLLWLLPIETRLRGVPLADLRRREEAWQQVALDPAHPEAFARAMEEVTRTQRVEVERALALGFPREDEDGCSRVGPDGLLEVPVWRHARVNLPHPLLQRGLVVVDTPGLNAIGAEPELTLGLLPSAHATVFVLSADAGVTRSDLAVWREHLSLPSLERFVVLNKIDTLADPLVDTQLVQWQIDQQCQAAARQLELPVQRVFPVSARLALLARTHGDEAMLADSRLPALEQALAGELLPRQRELLAAAAVEAVDTLRDESSRRLADRRRQCAEQLLELRGLRGRSGAKLRLVQQRLQAEAHEFETCVARLTALRSVHSRMMAGVLRTLSIDGLRQEIDRFHDALTARPLLMGAREAFATLCAQLRRQLRRGAEQAAEMRQMLEASSHKLNADYGFSFLVVESPTLQRFESELGRLETVYGRFLNFTQAWRLASPAFRDQFRRMLLASARAPFDGAAAEIELWSKSISTPMEQQLQERRQSFQDRHESLLRVEQAAGGLDERIAELEGQEQRLKQVQQQVQEVLEETLRVIRHGADDAVRVPPPVAHRDAA